MVMRIRLGCRADVERLVHHHPPSAPRNTMTMASPRSARCVCVFATLFEIVLCEKKPRKRRASGARNASSRRLELELHADPQDPRRQDLVDRRVCRGSELTVAAQHGIAIEDVEQVSRNDDPRSERRPAADLEYLRQPQIQIPEVRIAVLIVRASAGADGAVRALARTMSGIA